MRINHGNDLLVRIIYMYLLSLTAIYRRAIHVLRDLTSEITNGFYLSATCQAPVLCKYTNAASAHGEEVHYDILGGIFMHWWCLQWWNYDNLILCKLRYWLYLFWIYNNLLMHQGDVILKILQAHNTFFLLVDISIRDRGKYMVNYNCEELHVV